MDSDRFKRVADLYLQAKSLPKAELATWLEDETDGDHDLVNQVRLLIEADWDSETELTEIPEVTAPSSLILSTDFQSPEETGPYRVIKQIGEGGFGVVYVAQQREPVRRRVALKIMKRGLDSEKFVARFEAERQAAALMNHPNIARIYDAGTTSDGRPYFTMELIDGLPVTEYCDRQKLALNERLKLFVQICEAVHHAHQNGLIHRDIKPSNVLVTSQGATPKVIDFGVSKAIGGYLTEKTVYTARDQLVGTPEYMSPEQADLSVRLIDTRTDVYSLGAVLYELLVGCTARDSRTLRDAGLQEMRRILTEESVVRPSQKYLSSENRQRIAELRSTDPSTLLTSLQGDLDWIVMSCLEREIDRRYDSALELAKDVERYLNFEPVSARPPSLGYRLRKFVRRHRLLAGYSLILLLTIGAGLFGVAYRTWQLVKERDEAIEAKETANVIAELYASIVGGIKPEVARGRDTELLEYLIAITLSQAQKKLADHPDELARFDKTLAIALNRMGRHDEAVELLKSAQRHYESHPRRGDFASELVEIKLELSRVADYQENLEVALNLAQDGLAEALRIDRDGPDVLRAVLRYGQVLSRERKLEELEALILKYKPILSQSIDPNEPDLVALTTMLGGVNLELGRPEEAARLYEEGIRKLLVSIGENHPQTIRAFANGARAHSFLRNFEEAERLAQRAVKLAEEVLGRDHPDTLTMSGVLANILRDRGKIDEAIELYKSLVERRGEVYGVESLSRLTAVNNMASLLYNQGEYEQAETYFSEVVEVWTQVRGPDQIHTLIARSNLADAIAEQGRIEEAESMQAKVVEGIRRVSPPGHWHLGAALSKHGQYLIRLDRGPEGLSKLKEAYEILSKVSGQGNRRASTVADALFTYYKSREEDEEMVYWRERRDFHQARLRQTE